MSDAKVFDWPGLIRLGLFQLRLRPKDFWDLTPMELMVCAGLESEQATFLGRQGFEVLAALYPDTTDEE